MVTTTRVTIGALSAGLAPQRACSHANSDVFSYDNFTRIAEPDKWSYNGGPNLNTAYTGATGYISLIGAYCSRPDKMQLLWSYSQANGIAIANALRPKTLGGTINGLVNTAPALTPFGSRTLYGARWNLHGGPNSLAEVTDPGERARLLGDDPNAAAYVDTMRGISDWARSSPLFRVMLHDDGQCMFATHTSDGSFRESTWVGFTAHGQPQEYGAYLRTLYPNDAAYTAARQAGTVPAYWEARTHLLTKAFEWHGTARARAKSHDMEYVLNVANPAPTKHPQGPFPFIYHCDYGICELMWQLPWREGTLSRIPADRAAAELVSDATTLRQGLATMALWAMTMRGCLRRASFAIFPLLAWMPAKSGGATSAPSTAPYTVPYKVAAHQKLAWMWLQSLGCPSIIPAGIVDEAAGDVPEFGNSGFVGNNKPIYYMDPATARPWFDWVASSAEILDDFDIAATFAIVHPIIGDHWRGAADGPANNFYWVWMNSYIRPLIEANVPFVILPVDASLGYPAETHDLTKYRATVTSVNNVVTMPANLADLSPVVVSGSVDPTRPVLCTTRIDRKRNRLALHVINTHSCDYAANSNNGAVGTVQTAVTIKLKPWAMLTRQIMAARWYSHESSAQGTPVPLMYGHDGPTIRVPQFLEAGVVVLDFA